MAARNLIGSLRETTLTGRLFQSTIADVNELRNEVDLRLIRLTIQELTRVVLDGYLLRLIFQGVLYFVSQILHTSLAVIRQVLMFN